MNATEFFNKVREMRASQKAYYANRKCGDVGKVRELLNKALTLEGEIDAEIERVEKVLQERNANQEGGEV